MKKHILFLLSIALLAACTKEYEEKIDSESPVFKAVIEECLDTKIHLNESLKSRWDEGDLVSIFAGNTVNQKYKFNGATGDASGSFSQDGTSGFMSGSKLSANYSVYPYQSSNTISDRAVFSVSFPSAQNYAKNSFGIGANTMVAVTESTSDLMLMYKNACGYLRLSLYGDASISSITLQGNNGEKIAGAGTITASCSDVPSVSMSSSATESISIDCGDGVLLGTSVSSATDFYFVIPPVEFTKGITVTVTATNGAVFEKTTTKSISIIRNKIQKMAAVEFEGVSPVDLPDGKLCFYAEKNSSVRLFKKGSPDDVTLEYLVNGSEWKPYTIGDYIGLKAGESVYFRAGEGENKTFNKSYSNCYWFSMTGTLRASGNVMSLLDRTMERDSVPEYAFCRLFYNCTALIEAPDLDVMKLSNYCCYYMFEGCSNLVKAPKLSAMTLASHCYDEMFSGCTSLAEAPELPATTLAEHCYYYMFYGCKGLTDAPALPATTLAANCYLGMFKSSGLTAAPELPATTLAANCYQGMFSNSGLTAAPELPATVLAENCYKSMFSGCTSLTKAPELPATTLVGNCYDSMFSGCTNLTEPPKLNVNTLADYCYTYMFNGCTSLKNVPELPATNLATGCYTGMFASCTSMTKAPALPATSLKNRCYYLMFNGCTNLTDAPVLPAMTLVEFGYREMFAGCTSLKIAPKLPATTLGDSCYMGMFDGCTALTEAPNLPATRLYSNCYWGMFQDCTSLTKAPELPALSVGDWCYSQMFSGCTSLTEAPALPATSIGTQAYSSMFSGCKSLAKAPELPSTSLSDLCYLSMFYGCTSLTKAPVLSAKVLKKGCYYRMFDGCTQLNYVKMLATDVSASDCMTDWLNNVASTGTFVKNSAATWSATGASGVPNGWSVQYASE